MAGDHDGYLVLAAEPHDPGVVGAGGALVVVDVPGDLVLGPCCYLGVGDLGYGDGAGAAPAAAYLRPGQVHGDYGGTGRWGLGHGVIVAHRGWPALVTTNPSASGCWSTAGGPGGHGGCSGQYLHGAWMSGTLGLVTDQIVLRADAMTAIVSLARAQRTLAGVVSEAVGLPRPGLGLLRLLACRDSATIGEIATTLGVDQSVASRQVSVLVDLGFVERDVDAADRRVRPLRLTAAGHEVYARAMADIQARAAVGFAGWSAADLDEVTTLVGKNRVSVMGPEITKSSELRYANYTIDVPSGGTTYDIILPPANTLKKK